MVAAKHSHDDHVTTSFAEEALRLGGKSDEEVRRMGAVDTADDQVEDLYAERYRTSNSPVHRAIWDTHVPIDLFDVSQPAQHRTESANVASQRSLGVIRQHLEKGTLLDEDRKVSGQVMHDLADAGFWGMLIGEKFGGSNASFVQFAEFITRMATLDPTVAGLASVHGCIGAVDPLLTFGSQEQQDRLLPKLASGQRLSAFALTEPGAGSDLTALKTRAVKRGEHYFVTGEKLFITNVLPGRMIGIVCLIDDEPAVLIAELPMEEDEHFSLKRYQLYALQHAHNYGILFQDFAVPIANRLIPERGNGLTIAYHGLNRGRVSLCANAAGTMRQMLAGMIPWTKFRCTYGEAIFKRELVQRRIARMAGLIVACDALTEWCANLLDMGYRGEMECIIAKIFGSESLKEAAIELMMKTHGGRSFLHGHTFGDNVHDFLAPCIYEGEGEMLGMAFFKSLVKDHGRTYFEPIGKALSSKGIRQPNLINPAHLWALRKPMWNYGKWYIGLQLSQRTRYELPEMPAELKNSARFAARELQQFSFEISKVMRTHQLKLADRQCRMASLSERIQKTVVILCTSLYAARQENEIIRNAATMMCVSLKNELTMRRPTDQQLRTQTELGRDIMECGFPGIDHIPQESILMSY